MKTVLRIIPLLAAVSLCIAVGPVRAQSDDTLMLMNRLNDLDAQVQALKTQSGRGGAGSPTPLAPGIAGTVPAGPVAADLDVRLQQIQDQIRSLTGELESQGNEIAQLKTENQRMMQDMQVRLNDLEAKVGGNSAPAAEPASSGAMYGPAPSSPAPPPQVGTLGPIGTGPATAAASPEKDYEIAYNLLGQGDYAAAETGFSAFLQHYPKHALAANADYWLGETFYARGMMDKAAATFADTYKQYPNGAKAPDALLRLGMALGQEQKTQQACLSFAELSRQFPAASAKIKASLAQERARYKCQ